MQINHTITIWTAVVKYDMFAADNKSTKVKVFEDYHDAILFINKCRQQFVKEFNINKRFHNYGELSGDDSKTVNREVFFTFQEQFHGDDILRAESDTQDRMFARVDCHTL